MDDHRFDDIIKSRLDDYSDPEFNPASLASLHQQMAAFTVQPWYATYRTELITFTGFALCTILILVTQWYWNRQQSQKFSDELSALKRDQTTIHELEKELNYWKSVKPDTIRMIEIRHEGPKKYIALLNRINILETEIARLRDEKLLARINDDEQSATSDFATEDNLAREVRAYRSFSKKLTPRKKGDMSLRAVPKNLLQSENFVPGLSVKTMRDMEKHYRNGIGVRVGPVLEASRGIYSSGEGQYSIGYGALADLILSPSLSLETGAKYFKKYYDISDPADLSNTPLPGVDESTGRLHKAEIDYWLFEVPLNLKYRYPLSLKQHWLAGIGFSPMIYTRQVFEYDYEFNDTGRDFFIHSSHKNNKLTLYPGALNFSIGLSNQLKNRKILETTLFYQHGLNAMGVEQIRTRFFGLRGVYWFTLR